MGPWCIAWRDHPPLAWNSPPYPATPQDEHKHEAGKPWGASWPSPPRLAHLARRCTMQKRQDGMRLAMLAEGLGGCVWVCGWVDGWLELDGYMYDQSTKTGNEFYLGPPW